jgi:4-hydroxybenzoate polyprenyltransferase
MNKIRIYFNLFRVSHYIKNIAIFLPLFFGSELFYTEIVFRVALVFVAFCLIASGVYIINDFFDKESDSKHPIKKNRPLAAGEIRPFTALFLAAILFLAGGFLMFLLGVKIFWLTIFYVFINLLYTLKLKRVSILDVMIVAIGFVIRIFIGGFAANMPLSNWIIVVTFLLALFLAISKRKGEFVLAAQNRKEKSVINGYTGSFLDILIFITASATIISYLMYTVSPEVVGRVGHNYVYLTAIFVIAGIFRYMKLLFVDSEKLTPVAVIIKDRFIQITIILWLVVFGFLLYF